MMKKWILVLIIFMQLVTNCSTGNQQRISPKYKKNHLINSTMLVLPLSSMVFAREYLDSLATICHFSPKPLGMQEKQYFNKYMADAISDHTIGKIIGIDPQYKIKNRQFCLQELPLKSGHSLTMLIPEHGTFNYDGKSPNFVLFFDELYFKKSIEYIGGGLGSTGDRLFSMDVELQYFIWDNYYQQIVSYGKLTKTVNTFEYPKKDEYLKVLDSFASSIIMESPLVYRQLEIE